MAGDTAAERGLGDSEPNTIPYRDDPEGEYDQPVEVESESEHERTSPSSSTQREDSWDGYADFAHLPWRRRPSVYFLIGPYALFTLAFGGTIVPRLNLIIDLVCRHYFADRGMDNIGLLSPHGHNPQCQVPGVQRSVATFTLVTNVTVGLLSAFTAPRLGAWSDRYGRKGIMVITSCGGLLGEIVTILAASFPDVVSYKWLIAASVVEGLSGSFTAGSVASQSYTSDCTPPSKRSVSFGYVHACLFAGMALGPLLSGLLVEWTGSLLSIFYVTFVCHVVFALYVMAILPESLSPRRQMIAREKHAKEREALAEEVRQERERDVQEEIDLQTNPYAQTSLVHRRGSRALWVPVRSLVRHTRRSNPLAPLRVLRPKGPGTAAVRRNLMVLAAIDTTLLAAAMSLGSVTLLYSEFMFHWGNFETSAFISLVSMVRVLILVAVLPVLNYVFRTRPAARRRRVSGEVPVEANRGADDLDVWIVRSAIFSDVLGVLGYVFVRTPALFVLSGVVTAFGGLGSATIQSCLTKQIPADRVGELLGGIGLLHAVSRIVAPMIFNGLYAATVASFPQATFVLVSAFFIFVLALSFVVRPHVYLSELHEPDLPVDNDLAAVNDLVADDEIVPTI